ncbi:MAG: AMP-binding protein [Desulfuromonadales bacterium]|nr:AMP-binding protein [Desulfuromonadales bacterium]
MNAPVIDAQKATALYTFPNKDVPWLVKHWAEKTPEKPFLIWEPRDGKTRTWTYRAFWVEINKIACGLLARGVKKGDKLLIHGENSPEMVLAWYASALVGSVAVATNTRCVGEELTYFAEHSEAVGCITQPQFVKELTANARSIEWFVVTEDNSGDGPDAAEKGHGLPSFRSLYEHGDQAPLRPAEPMLPVGILFTSGTTARAKAVVHTHANALWGGYTNSQNLRVVSDDVYLTFMPFYHINAQGWCIWSMLWVGGTIVLQPKFSASRFWDISLKHKCTHATMGPFFFKAIAAQEVPAHSYKIWVTGAIVPQVEERYKVRSFAAWGMTETVGQATRCDLFHQTPPLNLGLPTPGYEYAILDPETGEFCQPGVNGNFYIRGTRGVQMFLEYYKNPEAMKKSFTDDGWFATGDMVRLGEDGYFYFSDRDKDVLKVGGENVSARQVEDLIIGLGGFEEIAVVAQKHDMLDEVPVLFAIRSPSASETEEELRRKVFAACEKNLADFKRPRALYFLDDFPRAVLQKIAKNKLRELADQLADQEKREKTA